MAGFSDYRNYETAGPLGPLHHQQQQYFHQDVVDNLQRGSAVVDDGGQQTHGYPAAMWSNQQPQYGVRSPYPGMANDPFYTEGVGIRTPKSHLSFTPSGSSQPESPEGDPSVKNYTAIGIGLTGLVADNLLRHPFMVLRRQCQVNVQSVRYHLLPVMLIGPAFEICHRQGLAVMWKGMGSTLLIRGITLAVEDVTSKVTPWPKEINKHSSMKSFFQHLLLKSVSLAVITPFYSASLIETVQSEVASETAGFFDVFREGFWRLLLWKGSGRLLPLHVLVIPTVAHGILSYLIFAGVRSVSLSTIKRVRENKERKQGALSKDNGISYYTEMTANIIGCCAKDILLFPLETILHRLHLQGSRTLIDNLDCGVEVTPIITNYNGVFDCIRSTMDDEGFSGLYKGFGALILQYGLQILLIRTVRVILEKMPFGQNSKNVMLGERASSTNVSRTGTPAATVPVHLSRSEGNMSNMSRGFESVTAMGRRLGPRELPRNMPTGGGGDNDGSVHQEPRLRSRFSNYSPATADSHTSPVLRL